MARIVGLPMYELEVLRPAFDRLWQGLRSAFEASGVEDVPEQLDRSLAPEQLWSHPDLLLGQTCGYPLTHALRGRVELVATPCYAGPFAAGPLYASLIMARADDRRRDLIDFRRTGRVAVNALESHSGHHALRATLARQAPGRWFAAMSITGSHLRSLEAVRTGAADLAAADCVIVALLERHAPASLSGLRLIEVSPPAPGLPLITARRTSDRELHRLRAGLRAAVAGPALEAVRRDLLIDDVQVVPLARYRRILELERRGRTIELPEPQLLAAP